MSDLLTALKTWKARVGYVRLYSDYYAGKHSISFASNGFKSHYDWILRNSRENLCEGVVDAFTNPIAVQSWQGGGGKTATELARRWRLPRLMNQTHDESFVSGDSYVLVWENRKGEQQPYFHSADQCAVITYDGSNDVRVWAKFWLAGKTPRITLVDENGMQRFEAKGITVEKPEDMTLDDAWPDRDESWTPVVDADDLDGVGITHPHLDVPVGWFPHSQRRPGGPGTSVLRNVVPLQDGLNHSLASLIVGSEAFAQPLRLLLGIEQADDKVATINADGELVMQNARGDFKIDPTKESIVGVPGKDVRAVQLDPPDATKLVAVQDAFANKISRVVGIPSFDLGQLNGNVPSGAALRILRERKTGHITDYQQDAGPEWARVMGWLGGPDAEVEWAEVSGLDPIEKMEVLEAKNRMGWPFEELLIDAGESPDNITRILQKKEQADARTSAEALRQLRQGGAVDLGDE